MIKKIMKEVNKVSQRTSSSKPAVLFPVLTPIALTDIIFIFLVIT